MKSSDEDSDDDYGSSEESQKIVDYLHTDILINSEKQNSAQGSVFYVKQ